MERDLLLKYLKFLSERAEDLMRRDVIERYEIAVLQRELRDFKIRFNAVGVATSALSQTVMALELKVSENDLEGEKAGVLRLLFGRGFAWQELERKRQLTVKKKIEDFRNEVSHVLFAIEV